MKTPTLVLIGLASFAVGVFFGSGPPRPTEAPGKIPASDSRTSTALQGQIDTSGFAGDDARIVRLFSALQEPVVLRRRSELFLALRDLTASDLPALVRHAEALALNVKSDLLPVLLERWFELDFAAAQAWMRAHPQDGSAIMAWAKANPDAALREALARPDDPRANRLLVEAIHQLGCWTAADQVAKLKTLPPGKLRDDVLDGVISEWAKTDPLAALAALGEIPAGPIRESARYAVLQHWSERDPAAALTHLGEILPTLQAGVLGNKLVTDIAHFIGAKDPRVVLEWLSGVPIEFRAAAGIAAARGLAAKEPGAALDWCVANGVEVTRGRRLDGGDGWMTGVLGEGLRSQPAATIEWLEARPPGPERDGLLERALKDSFWCMPKEQLFAEGSAYALRLFNELTADSQVRTATGLGEARAQQASFTDLHAWAQSFAPGEVRANALASAVGAAYERDASTVETYLASALTPADRDAALRGLAEVMRRTAPADAAERALAIGDITVRRETVESIFTIWQTRDAEAARAWLAANAHIPQTWKVEWQRTP